MKSEPKTLTLPDWSISLTFRQALCPETADPNRRYLTSGSAGRLSYARVDSTRDQGRDDTWSEMGTYPKLHTRRKIAWGGTSHVSAAGSTTGGPATGPAEAGVQ